MQYSVSKQTKDTIQKVWNFPFKQAKFKGNQEHQAGVEGKQYGRSNILFSQTQLQLQFDLIQFTLNQNKIYLI